ncbi:hypothetical protein N9H93_03970 [Rhizobiaceae bacterium]|nr:hypothetical protein [Rhizobiaceae bacterium]
MLRRAAIVAILLAGSTTLAVAGEPGPEVEATTGDDAILARLNDDPVIARLCPRDCALLSGHGYEPGARVAVREVKDGWARLSLPLERAKLVKLFGQTVPSDPAVWVPLSGLLREDGSPAVEQQDWIAGQLALLNNVPRPTFRKPAAKEDAVAEAAADDAPVVAVAEETLTPAEPEPKPEVSVAAEEVPVLEPAPEDARGEPEPDTTTPVARPETTEPDDATAEPKAKTPVAEPEVEKPAAAPEPAEPEPAAPEADEASEQPEPTSPDVKPNGDVPVPEAEPRPAEPQPRDEADSEPKSQPQPEPEPKPEPAPEIAPEISEPVTPSSPVLRPLTIPPRPATLTRALRDPRLDVLPLEKSDTITTLEIITLRNTALALLDADRCETIDEGGRGVDSGTLYIVCDDGERQVFPFDPNGG